MQEDKITFKSILANVVRRIDLRYQQLCAFAMRYYREISKKSSERDLLTKPRAILDITRLREMANLVNHLRFKSFEIIALKRFSKLVDSPIVKGNEKPAFVTNDLGKIRKDKCEMLYAQNYEENRKFLFLLIYMITSINNSRESRSTLG